ncbi:tropinone reductase homolog At5g06060-like [Wolffia australiana]
MKKSDLSQPSRRGRLATAVAMAMAGLQGHTNPTISKAGRLPMSLKRAPREALAMAMRGDSPGDEEGAKRRDFSKGRWSLEGKTALVTGGTRGIGRAVVEELASLGAMAYTCSRNAGELTASLEEWAEKGLRVSGSVCDISSYEQRVELMERATSALGGKLDILVNNAGTNVRKATTDFTPDDVSLVMATNFEAPFHLSQLAHPHLSTSPGGTIVFVSSVAGLVALCSGSLASASKAALNQLTRNLACEWAPHGVRVNAVAPWYTRTSLVEKVLEDAVFTKLIVDRIPLHRIAEPADVAAVVAFLCLPAAAYITGQVVAIDGGMTVNGFYPRSD